MKYLKLAGVVIQSLVLIGITAWLLFEFREKFVYGSALVSWRMFIAIAGGVFGVVFAIGAKICMREVNRLKTGSDNTLPPG